MLSMRLGFVAASLIVIGGCQYVGPISIDQGRDRYNSIIQSTSKEQTFENIIRVYHHEPTVFMDVTEVDATTTFAGSVTGGLAGIGAHAGTSGGTLAGQTGAVTGGVTYSESPLVRYQPLLGQSLVAQLATPVTPDALASLHDSYWGIAPLLDLTVSFLTLDYDNLYAAMNAIAELDYDSAVELVAEKSDATKAKDATGTQLLSQNKVGNVTLQVTNKSASAGGSDALVIYYLPDPAHEKRRDRELWSRLRRLYARTQQPPDCPQTEPPAQPAGGASHQPAGGTSPKATDPATRCPPHPPLNSIELRTTPVSPVKMGAARLRSGAPLMKTYSALGVLKNAAEQPHPRIGFVTPELYRAIRSYAWNDPHNRDAYLTFYTLLPDDENEGDERPVKPREQEGEQRIRTEVSAWLQTFQDNGDIPFVYEGKDYRGANQRLGYLRRYILIIHGADPPANAYVAHFERGEWYYIDAKDEISQKNFDLITLVMTMMAVPSTTPPLAPTISVGGGG